MSIISQGYGGQLPSAPIPTQQFPGGLYGADPPDVPVGGWILVEVSGKRIPVMSADDAATDPEIDWTTVSWWSVLP